MDKVRKAGYSRLILVFACSMFTSVIIGQESKFIRVKSGEDPRLVMPVAEKYRFDQFEPGTIHYRNGKAARARMNYNILLGEFQFINPAKDTLALDNENFIKHITIGESYFYFDSKSGFVEVIADFDDVSLAVNQIHIAVASEKEGAYGQSSGVSSIRNVSSIAQTNGQVSQLQRRGDLVFAKRDTYYIIDQNKRIHKANKKSFVKVFGKNKGAVVEQIKSSGTDFNDPEDLLALLESCTNME